MANIRMILFVAFAVINIMCSAQRIDVGRLNIRVNNLDRRTGFLEENFKAIWATVLTSDIVGQEYSNKTRTEDLGNTSSKNFTAENHERVKTVQNIKSEVENFVFTARDGLKREKQWQRETLRNLTEMFDDFQTGMTKENVAVKDQLIERLDTESASTDEKYEAIRREMETSNTEINERMREISKEHEQMNTNLENLSTNQNTLEAENQALKQTVIDLQTELTKNQKIQRAMETSRTELNERMGKEHEQMNKNLENLSTNQNTLEAENQALKQTIIDLQTELTKKQDRLTCDEDWISYNGHCYLSVEEKKTWYDASAYCENINSYLIEITTDTEFEFAAEVLVTRDYGIYYDEFWIGARLNGTFVYQHSKEKVPETFWCKGEPPNYDGNEVCVATSRFCGDLNFFDKDCTYRRWFVCETSHTELNKRMREMSKEHEQMNTNLENLSTNQNTLEAENQALKQTVIDLQTELTKNQKIRRAMETSHTELNERMDKEHEQMNKNLENLSTNQNTLEAENQALKQTIIDLQTELTKKQDRLTCDEDWISYYGHCYLSVEEKKTWYDASAYCENINSYLIEITTDTEFEFAAEVLVTRDYGIYYDEFWIGARLNGTFVYQHSKEKVPETFWCKGEPPNYDGNEVCVATSRFCGDLNFFDKDCTYRRWFVCETSHTALNERMREMNKEHDQMNTNLENLSTNQNTLEAENQALKQTVIDLQTELTKNQKIRRAMETSHTELNERMDKEHEQMNKNLENLSTNQNTLEAENQALKQTIIDLQTELTKKQDRLTCDEDWISYNGHCYLSVEEKKTWYDASAYCENINSYLIEITTDTEFEFAAEVLVTRDYGIYYDEFWIGARLNGTFVYQHSKEKVPETFWCKGEPPKYDGNEVCVATSRFCGDLNFFDKDCTYRRWFVCETSHTALNERMCEMSKEHEQMNTNLENLSTNQNTLEAENQALKQTVIDLQTELTKNQKIRRAMETSHTELNERMDKEHEQMNKNLENLSTNQNTLEAENQALKQTIIDLQTELTKKQDRLTCDEDWISYNGHCYLSVEEKKTWYDASAYCENINSYLIEITTDTEFEFAAEVLVTRDYGIYYDEFWIGARLNGTFVYQHSKEKVPETFWCKGEPPKYDGNEVCVATSRFCGDLNFFDKDCTYRRWFVCETSHTALNERMCEMSKEHEQMNTNLENLSTNQNTLEAENQALKQTVIDLQTELTKNQKIRRAMETSHTELNERMDKEHEQMNKNLENLSTNQNTLEAENQALKQTIIDLQTELTKKQDRLTCDEDWISYNGHCYLSVEEKKTWYDASAYCENINSYLIEITTDTEFEFAAEVLVTRDYGIYYDKFWIGARLNGTFVYQHSKEKVPETFWCKGEPPKYDGNEVCVATSRFCGDLNFFDKDCTYRRWFVCETSHTALNERMSEMSKEHGQIIKILENLSTNQNTLETENQALKQTIIDLQTELTKKQDGLTCDEDWSSYNGHCYLVVEETKTWDDASAYCENINSYLIEITTDAEFEFTAEVLVTRHYGSVEFWIGARLNGLFVYQKSKQQVPEKFGCKGEKNNYDGIEDCVVMTKFCGDLKFFDKGCRSRGGRWFVCEKP